LIESALKSYLSSVPALTSLIGTRLYPVTAPTDVAKPYCVYFKVSPNESYTHDGPAYTEPRMQISIFADTYASAKAVESAIRTALHSWEHVTKIEGSFDQYETANASGKSALLYHTAMQFFTFY
jgi:hypothetical protein